MAKIYEKIPGLGTGRGGLQIAVRARLYHGPDHLLIVQGTGYTEEYKRVFYRDIRYVEVRHTNGQTAQAIISMVIGLLLGLLFLTPTPGWLIAIFCSPFALWFVINLILGSTCECFISTNVQTLKVPAPRRLKKVVVLIEFLRAQTAAFASPETPQAAA
jgi:hypothetical protein